jgi:hypothetical protein
VGEIQRAKAEAALRGRKLKDLVAEGLRLVLETPRKMSTRSITSGVMPGAGRGRRGRRNDKSRTDGFRAPLAAWPSASGDEAPGVIYQRRLEPGLRVTNQLSAGRAPAAAGYLLS